MPRFCALETSGWFTAMTMEPSTGRLFEKWKTETFRMNGMRT